MEDKALYPRIVSIGDADQREAVARSILEALPEWFEIEETREQYIEASRGWPFIAAMDGEVPVGFLCLKETGADTVELAVMGVLKSHHRRGIGRRLVDAAKAEARARGYGFMQVKTVKLGVYEEYDRTNRFYRGVGFREFEVIPALWGPENPCQIYVMAL